MTATWAREIRDLIKNPISGVNLEAMGDSMEFILVHFEVPSNLPPKIDQITLVLKCPNNYPNKGPVGYFSPILYHPNVYQSNGKICHPMFDESTWYKTGNLKHLIANVLALLTDPNYDGATSSEVNEYWKRNFKP
jgi:ubiquitin-protein ligase